MKKYKFTTPEIVKQLNGLTSYFQKEKHFAPGTIKAYGNYTGYFLEWLQTEQKEPRLTTYNHLLQFIGHCKKESRTISNINTILIALRHYFDMLQVRHNPATGLQVRGEIKAIAHDLLNGEQLHRLYEHYPTYNTRTQRNKVITGLYVYQGVTTDELHQLEPTHIYLQEGNIYLPGSNTAHSRKGRQPRTLKLKANQILELQHYIQVTRPRALDGLRSTQSTPGKAGAGRKPNQVDWPVVERQLFISLNGSENLKPSIKSLMEDLRKIDPQVKDSIHIRQSVIVNWLKEKDIRQVQYMAGHSKISSTEKYRAANLEELEEALKIHHPLQ